MPVGNTNPEDEVSRKHKRKDEGSLYPFYPVEMEPIDCIKPHDGISTLLKNLVRGVRGRS